MAGLRQKSGLIAWNRAGKQIFQWIFGIDGIIYWKNYARRIKSGRLEAFGRF
jgi:hypothetical protein